jgi:hypothetical protein
MKPGWFGKGQFVCKGHRWLVAGLIAAAGLWVVLLAGIPALQRLPYWFWPLHLTPLPFGWVILPGMLAVLAAAAVWVFKHPERFWVNTAILMAAALVMQLGWVWMEGRGMIPLQERLLTSGHSGFLRQAVEETAIGMSVREYTSRWLTGDMVAAYPMSTKPPGQLAVYQALALAGQWLARGSGADPLTTTARLAAWWMPILACLVILPLNGISRRCFSSGWIFLPALVMATFPAFMLVQVHLDQALYPLLVMAPLWLGLEAWQRHRFGWLALVGGLVYLAGFVSFSLWAGGVLLTGVLILLTLFERSGWKQLILAGALLAGGFGAAYLLVWVTTGYDAWTAYQLAVGNHAGWKVTAWPWFAVGYAGLLNFVEWAVWMGPMAGAALVAETRHGLFRGGSHALLRSLTVALAGVVIWLAFGTETMGETARLWLFLLPTTSLVITGMAKRAFANQPANLAVIILVQVLTTLFIKLFMDF